MSIKKTIASHCGGTSPVLVQFDPPGRHRAKRRLYLAGKAINDFNNPQSATNLLGLKGYISASMMRWTSGGRVHGNKKRGLFLDRLDPPPDEVWEMRVTEPDIHVRLFGRFCEQDTLILTNFHTRGLLGPRGSQGWANAMTDCVTHWGPLGLPLLQGTTINEYVSENFDVFPI